jgi:hypothetical protein
MGYLVLKRRLGKIGEYDDAWYLEKKWKTGGGYKIIALLKKGRIVRLEILGKSGVIILKDRDARRKLKRILPTEFHELNRV